MNKYFVYIRKSTDEANRQVLSLDAQVRELRALAKRDGLVIARHFEESRSAKEPGRPIFNRMVDQLEKGDADGILVWDIDRLYRNPVDEGRVRWMLQLGKIASIRTPTRSFFPADAGLLMAVEGGRAADFIIRHKRNVSRGIEEKLIRGEWPGAKPFGYIYDHEKRNIVPHPQRAKLLKAAFEEYATGKVGLTAIADRLAESGIVTRSGAPVGKFRVHKMLSNKLYVGIMAWNSQTFEGKYQPLVSPELFAKVAVALKIRTKARKTRNGHKFPFCGLFHCSCGSMMSAQWAKGNGGLYRYYRCTRSHAPCGEKYVQERDVLAQSAHILSPLSISAAEAAHVRDLIEAEADRDSLKAQDTGSAISDRLSDVQGKLNTLTRKLLDGLIDQESYDAVKADLIVEKTKLKRQKERLRTKTSPRWIEPAKEVVAALELAAKQEIAKSPDEVSTLLRKTGTNLRISNKTVSAGFAPPYDFAANFLGPLPPTFAVNELPHGGDFMRSLNWSRLVDYLRTHFTGSDGCPY